MVATIKRASDGLGLQWDHTPTEYKISDAEMLVSGQATPAKIAAKLQEVLQAELDFRVSRSSLPDDEETKSVDPQRSNIFWDGNDIVSRSNIVTVEYVDGMYIPTVRVA